MDITERLRALYVERGDNYVQEAAFEIERLRRVISEERTLVSSLQGGIVEQTVRADEAEAACERQRELKMQHAARASELRTELEDVEADNRKLRAYAVQLAGALLDDALTREIAMQVRAYKPINEANVRELLDDIRQGIGIYLEEHGLAEKVAALAKNPEDASCPGSSETGGAARAAEPSPARDPDPRVSIDAVHRAPALKQEDAGVGTGPVQDAPSCHETWQLTPDQVARSVEQLLSSVPTLDEPPSVEYLAGKDQWIVDATEVLIAVRDGYCHQSCNNTAALTAAFGLLRRVRDRMDTVQFFEANAVMGLIEEALRDTASTAHSGAMDTTAGTSSPAAAGAAPASLHQVNRERTDADYAIEHAGYLAQAAADFLDTCNALDGIRLAIEEADSDQAEADATASLEGAQEAYSEGFGSVRIAIYEFEKRRDRALQSVAGKKSWSCPADPHGCTNKIQCERQGWCQVAGPIERIEFAIGKKP